MTKEKYRYIFPNVMARAMSKVSFQTQMESALLSTFLLLIGLSIMAVYLAFFTQGGLAYKIIVIFNILCGWLLMGSTLATTYSQYVSYMSAMNMPSKDEHRREIKKRGNIFKRIRLAKQNRKEKGRVVNEDTKREMIGTKDEPTKKEVPEKVDYESIEKEELSKE